MLPFSMPPYVHASMPEIRSAFVMDAVGLACDQVLGVVIDDKVALEQIHPSYSLMLLPLTNGDKISFEDALFYADCFAYEHEIPVIAHPRDDDIGIRFLIDKRSTQATRDEYLYRLCAALECINALRLGPLGLIGFRYYASRRSQLRAVPAVRLDYTRIYGAASKEIHLYSTALRQIDPLSEFLCYYRVFESVSRRNGIKWLEQNLPRLTTARFGMLPVKGGRPWTRRRTNLHTILHHRAVAQLQDLLKTMSYGDVAIRMYKTNRCGIAHDKKIRRSHFSADFREVYLDGFIARLMARVAIKDKL